MKEFVAKMIAVQDLDKRIFTLREEKALRPRMLADSRASLDRLLKKSTQHKESTKNVKKEIDKKNTELKSVEADLKKHQEMLNVAKSNKEYQIIKDAMLQFNNKISALEQEILSAMDGIENNDGEGKQLQQDIARKEAEHKELTAKVEKEIADLDRQITDLQTQRSGFLDGIPHDILTTYERIAEKNRGVGLVAVVSGICQGCFRMLNNQEINRLMAGNDVLYCSQCGRIEYLQR